MQSDEDDFDEAVESHTPDRKTQNPEGRFSLRQTPARVESEKKKSQRMESQRKDLFDKLTPRSEETTGAAAFSSGISRAFNFESNPVETENLKCNYTAKEKADRLQEEERNESQAEAEFPNPLGDICGTDTIEEDLCYDIPLAKGITREEENHIETLIKVNTLRRKRAAVYACITRGEKTMMRKFKSSDLTDWELIQTKTRESFNTLTRIMENLQMHGLERTPGEIEKYFNYSSRLKKMMAKIDHIIETIQANIPGLVEALMEQYVQDEHNLCDGKFVSGSGYAPDSRFQQDDVKRRKDAEDHKKKMFDLNDKLQTLKKSSASASNVPAGLTQCPDPTRTQQGANAQTGPHQNAGPQFMRQPPPPFPDPPPMPPYIPPPQQNFVAQAAAGFLMKPQPNYHGITKVKVSPFDGSEFEYQRFKLTFHAAYDARHLPPKHLALLLESSLKGRPLTIISEYMRTCIDDLSYDRMWELLEE
jgi:hypothetical protein